MTDSVTIRAAVDSDVPAIARLLDFYARQQIVLARDEDDIRHYLRNFRVAVQGDRLLGCVAVRDFGNRLFEVRSLVVDPECRSLGIGRKLVESARLWLEERVPEGYRLFTLTCVPEFFEKLGFTKVGRELFPEKIWCDCNNCPKQDNCDEVALLYSWKCG